MVMENVMQNKKAVRRSAVKRSAVRRSAVAEAVPSGAVPSGAVPLQDHKGIMRQPEPKKCDRTLRVWETPAHRSFDCRHYNECLSKAARENWLSFSCEGCAIRFASAPAFAPASAFTPAPAFAPASAFAVVFIALCMVLFPLSASPMCFEEAGRGYGISPALLYAIAKVESNLNPGAVNRNTNGSYDYGLMQINSGWYAMLGRDRWERLSDACYNVHVGAWILRQCIDRYGYTWDAVGCYNASSKPKRTAYAWKIYSALRQAGY